jgi:hypothetical protein
LYPWHPWSGVRVGIHEVIERPGGVVFRCDLKASDLERWLEIPAWMFDRSACAKVRLEGKPHTDLAALARLAALVWDIPNRCSATADAADSGVSPLRDQNRGERHAMPEEEKVGTLRRAAAIRAFRKARDDDRRRANVVRAADGDTGGSDHLMARLILDYAANHRIAPTEGGHDL